MAEPYVIPFDIDGKPLFDTLNRMDASTEKLGTTTQEAEKVMQGAIEKIAGSYDGLGKKLDLNAEKTKILQDRTKAMSQAVADTLSGKGMNNGLEERMNRVKKVLDGMSKGQKIPFQFDQAALQKFEDMIESGADELKVLTQVVDYAKQKLATLDTNSEEFKQLAQEVATAEKFLQAFGQGEDNVGTKSKSLKGQLREMKEELARMEQEGEENTREFLNMSVAAGKLEDQIGDTSARIRVLASDTKYIDAGIQAVTALAGGFAAAQGTMALFGGESEEVNKIIQKVTGAMALLQGIQAISIALNKDSALSVLLFSRAQATATTTTTALATAETGEAAAATAATTATKGFLLSLLTNPIFLTIAALAAVVLALVAFTDHSDEAADATERLNSTIERQNELLKDYEGVIKRTTDLQVARAKQAGKSESEITGIEIENMKLLRDKRREDLAETQRLVDEEVANRNLSADDRKKLFDRLNEQQEDFYNIENDIQVKGIDQQTQRNKEIKELDKKRTEDAKKSAEDRQKIIEQEIKFRRAFTQAFIDSILDESEKEKQAAIAKTNQAIEDLEREKSLSVKAEREKKDLIVILRQNLTQTLHDIDDKRIRDAAALQFEANKKLVDLQKEGTQQQIDALKISTQEQEKAINEQFKNDGETRVKLLAALRAQEAREEKKIKDAATNQALKDEEERAILEVETAAKFIKDLPGVELEKQKEILKVKIDFAQRGLQLLLDQGKAENSTVVLQAKKSIQDLQKALGKVINDQRKKGGGTLEDIFGLTPEGGEAVREALGKAKESISQITDFVVSQYQRQIDARQKVIDAENEGIKTLEDQLKEEQKLRDEGLANNVAGVEAELAAKKQQRDEDIKQQEELQKKQQNIQKAQLAIDSISQASNLFTASSSIFKSLSPLGPVGVALAVTTIALMIGSFIAAKVKALQAINDGGNITRHGAGGWIDGKKHTQGGKKYIAMDGSGDVKELEEGEHVTRASQAEKYAELLEAVNEDNLHKMSEAGLRAMLAGMGIHLSAEDTADGLNTARQRESLKTELLLMPGGDITGDVKQINQGVTFLADQAKQTQYREDENYKYEERPGYKLRIKKRK